MGRLTDAKVTEMTRQANDAWQSGQPVFTPAFTCPDFQAGVTGPVADWAAMIAVVEQFGWRMEHWAAVQDPKGRPLGLPIFRRSVGRGI
jgi:hypothetical protein